jgi:hypothetical protein
MFRRIPALLLALLPLIASAQEPVVLKNTGQPIRVPFECAEEELQAAGLLCTEEEPCAIYLELNAVAPAGRKIFLGGDVHATSGTLASILLASDDGGLTWKEPAPRVRHAAIDQLQIYDLEHGWAAGEVQYPLPADPFFLVTSDGGQSWRKRPVSDDGGPGSVQRFWFDSAKHGELIVDAGRNAEAGRYVMWESETGGESWNLRSATVKMPSLKRAPPEGESDFRIRADAAAKSFQIEKRAGESKWESVAAFLIEAASCKVKPPVAKEPPPEPSIPPAAPPANMPKEAPPKDFEN